MKKLIVAVIVFGFCGIAGAADWTAADPNDNLWSTANNWNTFVVPTSGTRVDIDLDGADKCVIDANNVPTATSSFVELGGATPGELEMRGATFTTGEILVGEQSGRVGTFTALGGNASINAFMNRGGTANVNLLGGTIAIRDKIYLSEGSTGNAFLTIGGTANVTVAWDFRLALNAGSQAIFNMTGGTCSGSWSIKTGQGNATINVSGGYLQTRNEFVIADGTGVANATITDGTVNADNFIIGNTATSTGTCTMTGGLLEIRNNLQIGAISKMHFSGGTIKFLNRNRVTQVQQLITDLKMDADPKDKAGIRIEYIAPDTIVTYVEAQAKLASSPSPIGDYCPTESQDRVPPLDVSLSWVAGVGATSHNVYFSAVESEVTGRTALVYTGASPSVTVNGLAYFTTYYWAVDEVGGGAGAGDLWSFTTTDECFNPCSAQPVADLSGDCQVNLVDFAMMAAQWLECGKPVAGCGL